nr:MgtC/SapB family protein [Thermoactinomyces daqus]
MQSIWEISWFEVALRLFLAGMLGGVVGWERERNNHPAGFRTHILVSLGSALIMLISIYGFSDFVKEANVRIDPARLAAQVVSGIGFLVRGRFCATVPRSPGLPLRLPCGWFPALAWRWVPAFCSGRF